MATEKRKNPRFKCAKPQNYPVDFKDHKGDGCLFDLSRDGISFQSSKHFKKNDVSKFEIWVSVLEKPISCEASIMWVKVESGTENYTCGARILKMDPSSKIDLLDILYKDWKQKAISHQK